jgi:hypothetical protein
MVVPMGGTVRAGLVGLGPQAYCSVVWSLGSVLRNPTGKVPLQWNRSSLPTNTLTSGKNTASTPKE